MQRRRASRREAELDEEGKRTQQRVTESQERLAIEGQEDETVRGAEEEEKMTKKGSSKGLLEIEDVKPAGSEQPPNSTKNTYVVPAAPQGIPTAFGGDMVPVPRTPIPSPVVAGSEERGRKTGGPKMKALEDRGRKSEVEAPWTTPRRTADRRESMETGGELSKTGPPGRPTPQTTPLFTEHQIRQFDLLHQQAPWLYPPTSTPMYPSRPLWMEEEERRVRRLEHEREVSQRVAAEEERMRRRMQDMILQHDEERYQLMVRMNQLEEENQRLKTNSGSRYGTPEEYDPRKKKDVFERIKEAADHPKDAADHQKDAAVHRKEAVDHQKDAADHQKDAADHRQDAADHQKDAADHQKDAEDHHKDAADHQKDAADHHEENADPQKEAEEVHRPRFKMEDEGHPQEDWRSVQEEEERKPRQQGGEPDRMQVMMQSMLKVMEGMQQMQHQILDVKKAKEVEIVKNSVMELPKLQEWRAETAPLDLTDWLLTIEPTMGDLSDGSQQWWDGVLRTSRQWYADHLMKSPLDKVNHRPTLPPELEGPRYQRLEKRATSLLMAAIPQGQQEEVVASKNVSVINILGKLMISYQPGGLSEKCAILNALDSPEEAQNLTQAVQGLRRWLRWHRRAGEVGVVRPDATIQVKGLGRLMKRVLKENNDLAFRIQLSKSSLQIDTAPTETAVLTYANHLMAEVEQIAHQDKKKREDQRAQKEKEDAKMKRAEENGGWKGEGKGQKGSEKMGSPCKFFNTDDGCWKGKLCTWVHTVEGDKKRCWNCGSVHHFSPSCDRPKEPPKDLGSPEKGWKGDGKGGSKSSRTMKKEEESPKKEEAMETEEKGKEEGSQRETVEDLLKEANRMLKGLSAKEDGEEKDAKDTRLAAMQRQLDELRKMKTLRLSRIAKEETMYGLLHSGATHPMRGRRKDEDVRSYETVTVTLADGSQTQMKMSNKGVMVVDDPDVEPIIPMGMIGGELGFSITWKDHQVKLTHPKKGTIKVHMKSGCPQIPRHVALQMIRDFEEKGRLKTLKKDEEKERVWLEELVKAHPVLKKLPEHIKAKLPVTPSEDLRGLPGCNRRKRKLIKDNGLVVNLYAGNREGYTMERAVKEVGGDQRLLVEIDLLREEEDGRGSHNMLADDGPYSALMRAALDGSTKALILAPNCRTRSVLRHYYIENGPRPVRSWEEPWGMQRNDEEEMKKVQEDDLLMWRGLMLYVAQEEMRKAMGRGDNERLHLGLEQPADPTHYMEETVTFWKTEEWQALKRMYGFQEQSFRQSDWGGLAKKPTTFAGNLPLDLPEELHKFKKEDFKGNSKDLSRWAPGFMKEVARQLQKVVWKKRVRAQRMSWEEHCQRGHTPFRRDCQVCQEATARGKMHQKVKHPRAGVMSLDVSGPYKKGNDIEEEARFMLVGDLCVAETPRRRSQRSQR